MASILNDKKIYIKKLIKKNKLTEFEGYIRESELKLEDLNGDDFDILLYSIENSASLDIVDFIIKKYQISTLNYSFVDQNESVRKTNSYGNIKAPLFTAVNLENFELANLLLNYNADINYKIEDLSHETFDIISCLTSYNCLNYKKLNYILNHGFSIQNINTNLINNLINYKGEIKNDLLESIFRHYIYDNDFVLSLLHFYKNHKLLSNKQLQHMIIKEKLKIEIKNAMYDCAVKSKYHKKCDVIYILLEYDGSNPYDFFFRINQYDILNTAIKTNDYYLVKKILSYKPWKIENLINFENTLIKAIEYENMDIIKELINSYNFNFKTFNFENVLMLANQKRANNIHIILFLIETLLNNKFFNTNQNINFKETIILADFYHYLTQIYAKINININANTIKLLDFVIKTSFKNFTNDFNKGINLENILFMTNFTEINDNNIELPINYLLNTNFMDFNFNFNENLTPNKTNISNNDNSKQNMAYKNKKFFVNKLIDSVINTTLSSVQKLDIALVKKKITSYLTFILNMAIELEDIDSVKKILENEKIKPFIDIEGKDSNCKYAIITAYDHSNSIEGEEIFKYILSKCVEINVQNTDGISLFKYAIKNRNYRMVKHMLKYPIHFEEKEVTNNYSFPLIMAVYNNNEEEVRSIAIKNNYRLDIYTYTNIKIDYSKCLFTPLILSYILGYTNIFQFLVKYADIDALDSYGYSILHYAILKEDIETINYLIGRGAGVNYRENAAKYGHSALDITINIGNSEIFQTLLNSKNILFNIPNKNGELPLSTIIKSKLYNLEDKKKMMETLLKRGSYINFIDVNSPLKDAIQEKSLPLINILLDYEASVNYIYEKNGYSPLVYAVKSKSLPIVKLLVEKGADVNYILPQVYDGVKETVLIQATEVGDLKIFEYLLKSYAAISFDNGCENNRFIDAINKSGKTEIFEYLIKNNLNRFTDNIINSVIYLNQINLLKILLDYNFDINLKDENGDTPLSHAIQYSNEYFVDYFIYYGASMNNINNNGETIYDISRKYSKRLRGHTIYEKIKNFL
ncbi:ankyrin [Neocallimastix lanati (nom. inval.)]|uniref:Ankyrin n=1 Tax=Neocallimastix californiae TaxID=1754190 RepID=A0A1Y2ETI5_9FUNG|nr:ankyrin [Neocallimastix sp. JGI-2020a]ORY74486.1 ankyrin [Neocallimastix californiae]|eukprot:ORY74486.1 ankyrin [Neocallimastix californiae]